ncbi:MAG TPA: Slp family lipoprotein, partial [Nitrosomonas sp.]|nr:Slp family lipoprotein [Nitrosomonas sp.]
MRKILSLICYLFLLSACTSLPDVIKNIPVIDVSYGVVAKDVSAYKNKQVRWGGVIIQTETEKELSFVQILFYPLDSS